MRRMISAMSGFVFIFVPGIGGPDAVAIPQSRIANDDHCHLMGPADRDHAIFIDSRFLARPEPKPLAQCRFRKAATADGCDKRGVRVQDTVNEVIRRLY
jgi:hypothetical protein